MALNQEQIKSLLGDLEINESALSGLVTLVEDHVKKALSEAEEKAEKDKEEAVKAAMTEAEEKAEKEKAEMKEEMEKEKEELKEAAEKYGAFVKEQITSRVDEYTDYAVKEFIKENEEKFKQLEDYSRMKSIFESVKASFETNGFPLNENAQFDSLKQEIRDAKQAYNSLFEDLVKVKEELDIAKKAVIFEEATRDLTDTQKLRLKELSESVEFHGIEEFTSGISLLMEQLVKEEKAPAAETLNESSKMTPAMEAILKALGN